jgi:SAM-dependent methyltransferase
MKLRTHCPACLSTELKIIYEEPYQAPGVQQYLRRHYEGRASRAADDYTFQLTTCDSCGLTFQKQVPDDAMLDELYNRWVPGTELERTHRDYSLDQYRSLAEQIQFIIEHFGTLPSQLNLLDFGFGWAHWAKMAMGFGCNVSGTDFSEERRSYGKSVGIEVVDLENLPPKKFHFINTEQVFEHLTEPREVLGKLLDSLAPDGLIKISVPNAVGSLKKISHGTHFGDMSPDEQGPLAPLEHVNSFSADSLEAFGKTMGLKVIRPSFRHLYNGASGLLAPKTVARTLLRPVYRHVFPRSTFVYFARA